MNIRIGEALVLCTVLVLAVFRPDFGKFLLWAVGVGRCWVFWRSEFGGRELLTKVMSSRWQLPNTVLLPLVLGGLESADTSRNPMGREHLHSTRYLGHNQRFFFTCGVFGAPYWGNCCFTICGERLSWLE